MIKFENTEVIGWEAAIRGMRNPKNSWYRSDSTFYPCGAFSLGDQDSLLMIDLASGGPVHSKYKRMIVVYVDITAPLYWWKEFDTYKVGTVANSCSTMHKIHVKEFSYDEDFSTEHLMVSGTEQLMRTIKLLNECRDAYNNYDTWDNNGLPKPEKKDLWWQMIQLLPSSYNQKRTVMLNYEVLTNIYKYRHGHKLDEWSVGFMEWIKSLPHSYLITQEVFE